MAVWLAPCSTFSRPPTLLCKIKRRISISCSSSSPIPARDRVIDFGRHRGMMLGALPSKYLKWVSKNLRARDLEEWAKLADQVLEDPVYKDRIEWEFAESLLTGGDGETSRRRAADSVVDELVEFSQRFGWDNDDKLGWSRIDFSLLGTSKGRRIPRKGVSNGEEAAANDNFRVLRNKKKTNKLGEEEEEKEVDTRKREARIERQRLRRRRGGDYLTEEKSLPHHQQQQQQQQEMVVNKKSNPFPGRESLLKKVFDGRRRVP